MIWPHPDAFKNWVEWARQLVRHIEEHKDPLVRLPVLRVQELPPASPPGMLMYVRNGLLGPELVVSDGVRWRRVSLGAEAVAGIDAKEDFLKLNDVGTLV